MTEQKKPKRMWLRILLGVVGALLLVVLGYVA